MKLLKGYSCLLTILTLLWAGSCTQKAKSAKQYYFFDVEGFFEREAKRLTSKKPVILKSVSLNNTVEEKKIEIEEWSNELQLFKNSDINKPAWKDSYRVIKTPRLLAYSATDSSLKTREVKVFFSISGKVDRIFIYNVVENILYTSQEQLEYFPDSIYRINKNQKVKFLGKNTYKISAKIF